jgi:3-hydroxyacyl-CoA dehydrogenase/enoyl-CoA hydratase/3-hydroxybutyryl-CoA epimerase
LRAIEVVEVGVRRGLEAGLEAEARATGELAVGEVCKSLIHIFKLMEAAKREGTADESGQLEIGEAAVLGAGVMGGGIAQLLADRADMSLDYAGFQRVGLVIEAIVEDLKIKQKVFAEVAARVGSEVILASNTSSLSVDLIGQDTPNPERVVGMHFFNPVHRMPLVEVIEGPKTSPLTVQTVLALCRRMGKTPVVVQDGPGFLVNRLLTFYMAEALWLLSEGREIEEIDGAMSDWGMPMGPLALIDAVGIDVAVKVSHILAEAFGDRLPLPTWVGHLDDPRRLGMKTGSGFYLYKGGERTKPDPEIRRVLGLADPSGSGAPGPLVDRMVLPMVNEAARCLAEQVVRSPSDLDLAMIMGTGFPPFRGGLCRWADLQGIEHLVESLARLAEQYGERFRPSEALVQAAEGGGIYPTYS